MSLKDYERAKFELAEILRALQTDLADRTATAIHDAARRDGGSEERLREIFIKLAEDRFDLVVVGRFSRGKSTLMNAILGRPILPIGIVPLTSVITTLAYGSHLTVTLKYRDHRLEREIPLAALAEHITERGNPGNVRGVRCAEVRVPADILRRGFHFVDTPGLGSPIVENTRTTQEFLPHADALLLVTSYESPLSAEELEVLRSARVAARSIFVVVNKQDILDAGEREEALRHVRNCLGNLGYGECDRVFSVSARDAFEGYGAADSPRRAASGVEALKRELIRFLVTKKRREFLRGCGERVRGLIRELASADAASGLLERTRAWLERIGVEDQDAEQRADGIPLGDLQPGFGAWPRCEICEHILGAVFDLLREFQHRLAVRIEAQRAHAERGGFCTLHTWQYALLASTHGLCTGYPALLEHQADRIRSALRGDAQPFSVGTAIDKLLVDAATCVICRARDEAERIEIHKIVARLTNAECGAHMTLPSVCLPHMRSLAAELGDARVVRGLLAREAELLDRLAEDMRRYATKQDAVRRHLASEEETLAGRAALELLVGLPNVSIASVGRD